jgi:deoxycytidine triphosphate deaminase
MPQYEDYAKDDAEAAGRALEARDDDPLPDLRPALLSSEHIQEYVKHTGMLWPFHPDSPRLKPASYEIYPSKTMIYWDENGRKIVQQIKEHGSYELRANSITFMQLESRIRLPNYIAVRFNLRITHVHRGLLLGTGPLVDPGFDGELLIPIHNLTSDTYVIRADEGLIWIEFTKTSRDYATVPQGDPRFKGLESYKTNREPEYYFERASNNNPIQSSIPGLIKEAREKADRAAADALAARRTNEFFAGVGVVAIFAAVVGIAAFFATMESNVMTAVNSAGDAKAIATEAKVSASDGKALQGEVRSLQTQSEASRSALDEANERLRALEAEVRRLSDQIPRAAPPR